MPDDSVLELIHKFFFNYAVRKKVLYFSICLGVFLMPVIIARLGIVYIG